MATEPALPFGQWPSPISAEMVASGGVGLAGVSARGQERWWLELRPLEAGRSVLVRGDLAVASADADGSLVGSDVIGADWSVRTRVHEYGGGAWALGKDSVYFSNWEDQRLYRLPGGAASVEALTPEPLTPGPPVNHGWRFADGTESPDGKWFVCVREDHTAIGGENKEPVNEIVAVAADGSTTVVVLVSSTDFVAAPRLSSDGTLLSWYQWNHPNMPWDGTELCVASFNSDTCSLTDVRSVAGSSSPGAREAIHGSDWLSTGELVFSTDRSGHWNLHSWDPATGTESVLSDLTDGEIGGPPWVFGVQHWVELAAGTLAVVITADAADVLAIATLGKKGTALRKLDLPFVTFGGLSATDSGTLLALAGSSTSLPQIVEIEPAGGYTTLYRPEDLGVDESWISKAERFDFESANGRKAHAYFYPPTGGQSSSSGSDGHAGDGQAGQEDQAELPPLIVLGHGGPTAHSSPDLSLKVQYWTSRGIAVVDVNYGGSTGYGRAYRRLLDDAWGIVDVEDCVSAAEQLAQSGRVDAERMAIRGGSAGGFTVLRALQVSDSFSAGTSLYGVADLVALARDTHKFEARYLDGLIGPYPEAQVIYDERSPINHTDDLSCPLLVMQGSEDEVVPPSQSEVIVEAVAKKGLPHAYLLFEGEQHGFRRSETIVRSLEAELWFYGRVFGFEPHDSIDPVLGAVGL